MKPLYWSAVAFGVLTIGLAFQQKWTSVILMGSATILLVIAGRRGK